MMGSLGSSPAVDMPAALAAASSCAALFAAAVAAALDRDLE